jgi:predicted PurR-regulated permease PerM
LQPFIYGKSVHAHPIEIFIVILAAAKIGGVLGMIFAVPVYTLARIVVKEFFGQYFLEKEPDEDKGEEGLTVDN